MGWFIVATISLGLCFTLWACNKPWAERFVFKALGWTALALGLGFLGVGFFSTIYLLTIGNNNELEKAVWMIAAGVCMLVFVGINVLSEKRKPESKKEV